MNKKFSLYYPILFVFIIGFALTACNNKALDEVTMLKEAFPLSEVNGAFFGKKITGSFAGETVVLEFSNVNGDTGNASLTVNGNIITNMKSENAKFQLVRKNGEVVYIFATGEANADVYRPLLGLFYGMAPTDANVGGIRTQIAQALQGTYPNNFPNNSNLGISSSSYFVCLTKTNCSDTPSGKEPLNGSISDYTRPDGEYARILTPQLSPDLANIGFAFQIKGAWKDKSSGRTGLEIAFNPAYAFIADSITNAETKMNTEFGVDASGNITGELINLGEASTYIVTP